MHIKLAPDMDYSGVPVMTKFEPVMSIASGLSTPKIITAIANNGEKFRQLVN
jgi:ataxia telangiectasia mutated family protein